MSNRPAEATWRVVQPRSKWQIQLGIRQLWESRELAVMLVWRNLVLRYRQAFFGVAWAVLQPVIGVGLFSVLFDGVTKLPSDRVPYPVFVLTGLSVWFFVSTAVSAASQALVEQPDLIAKVWIPRILPPTAAVLAAGADFAVSLLLVAIACGVYGIAPGVQVLTLPIWIGAAFLTAAGAGMWFSAANVLYRDVRYVLPFAVQVWFFASPIVFSGTAFHGAARVVFACNPVTGIVDGLRWAILRTPAPGVPIALSAASLVLLLLTGLLYFRLVERQFADRI